jgi:signal transduction histidine kinase
MAKPSSETTYGIPLFLDQLAAILIAKQHGGMALTTAGMTHGADLLRQGFTISQVVHDYGDVCQAITALVIERAAAITAEEFQLLNRCLDEAIAGAVTEYMRKREFDVAADSRARATQEIGILSYEIRTLVWSAELAFEALKTGSVGIAGSTGALVTRSLTSLRNLVERSLTVMNLKGRGGTRERISVAELVEVVKVSVMTPAAGPRMDVEIADADAMIEEDLQVLAPILGKLVQNAFDYTHVQGHVVLRSSATEGWVRIEIEDQCGGLLPGTAATLLECRTGTVQSGLGLAFRGIEEIGGTIQVRDLPGKGCVFTVALPRVA